MKNIWLHSIVMVIVGAALLLASQTLAAPLATFLSKLSSQADLMGALMAPVSAFAILVPALVLGWFTRRHPLVIGAVASIVASLLGKHFFDEAIGSQAFAGQVAASAMYVAVAALAGRALRYRFTSAAVCSDSQSV